MNDDYMRHTRIANAVQSTVSRAIHYHQVTEQKGKNFYTHGSGNFMPHDAVHFYWCSTYIVPLRHRSKLQNDRQYSTGSENNQAEHNRASTSWYDSYAAPAMAWWV